MKGIVLTITVAVLLTSMIAPVMADPHASKTISFTISNGEERAIRLILGHTREPTLALAPGIHDGAHHVQIIIRDARTNLPINAAKLQLDRYYFKDLSAYESGDLSRATMQTGLPVERVFGIPGEYTVRQILTAPGIYGYRVYGTVTYFDGTTVNIDERKFCSPEGMSSTQGPYDTPGWGGGYGCADAVRDLHWPPMPAGVPGRASFDLLSDNLYTLLFGVIVTGSVAMIRLIRRK